MKKFLAVISMTMMLGGSRDAAPDGGRNAVAGDVFGEPA